MSDMEGLSHPERVAAAVPEDCKVVALLHDAVEDGHISMEAAAMSLAVPQTQALGLLSRPRRMTYSAYINRIAWNVEAYGGQAARMARTVKIADLRDNLYHRPEGPPPESLRKRYEKALATLEGT